MIKMLLKFALVGLSGVGVNMVVYITLTSLNASYLAAAGCSFIAAVTNNFVGNALWTFKDRAQDKSTPKKYLLFLIISTINLGVNLFILQFLVESIKIDSMIAQLVAIGMASGLNFVLNYLITFAENRDKQEKEALTPYETGYNTHLQ